MQTFLKGVKKPLNVFFFKSDKYIFVVYKIKVLSLRFTLSFYTNLLD